MTLKEDEYLNRHFLQSSTETKKEIKGKKKKNEGLKKAEKYSRTYNMRINGASMSRMRWIPHFCVTESAPFIDTGDGIRLDESGQ